MVNTSRYVQVKSAMAQSTSLEDRHLDSAIVFSWLHHAASLISLQQLQLQSLYVAEDEDSGLLNPAYINTPAHLTYHCNKLNC